MSNPSKTKDAGMKAMRDVARETRRVLAGACLVVLAGPLWANGDVHYYDGDQPRRITRQADLVAEFGRAAERGGARPAAAGAQVVAGDSLVRIYRLPKVAARSSDAAAGSPVYREGNSPAGRLMALPGGVLVKFKPDWTRERIDAFLAARGLAAERKLAIAGNWFLVATPAGDPSLAAANAIYESGEVLAASPNWWKQTVTR